LYPVLEEFVALIDPAMNPVVSLLVDHWNLFDLKVAEVFELPKHVVFFLA
jgi:hypothetical protein